MQVEDIFFNNVIYGQFKIRKKGFSCLKLNNLHFHWQSYEISRYKKGILYKMLCSN